MIIVIVIATVGVVNMPSFLATYRKTGVLRRLAVTPLHPAAVLAAQGVAGMIQTAFGVALAVLIAVLAGAPWPAAPWLTVAALVLATVALFAVGLVVAALAPTVNSALTIGLLAFFGMSSIGGMFGPVDHLPAGVSAVGEALPFGAAVHAVVDTWNGDSVPVANLISLGVCTVVCGLIAVRWFRWT
jgi:ABC-2 type transport system permease protein